MSTHAGSPGGSRPKPKTPAERGEEFAAEQRRLKQEAAERRDAAARKAEEAAGSDKRAS